MQFLTYRGHTNDRNPKLI